MPRMRDASDLFDVFEQYGTAVDFTASPSQTLLEDHNQLQLQNRLSSRSEADFVSLPPTTNLRQHHSMLPTTSRMCSQPNLRSGMTPYISMEESGANQTFPSNDYNNRNNISSFASMSSFRHPHQHQQQQLFSHRRERRCGHRYSSGSARVVSMYNMAEIRAKKPDEMETVGHIPFQSLKDLVQSKQSYGGGRGQEIPAEQRLKSSSLSTTSTVDHKRSLHDLIGAVATTRLASVFGTPSSFFLQQEDSMLKNAYSVDKSYGGGGGGGNDDDDVETAHSDKRQKLTEVESNPSLHEACRCGDVETVQYLLQENPAWATCAVSLKAWKTVYDPMQGKMISKEVNEGYTYAINLAIQYKAPMELIKCVMNAAPHVLGLPDGYQKETSLHVAFKYDPQNQTLLKLLLLENPQIASRVDRHENTPLHAACSSIRCSDAAHGSLLNVVRHLCALHPEALFQRNFHGMTPLQLAQRNGTSCSSEIATFLWERVEEKFN